MIAAAISAVVVIAFLAAAFAIGWYAFVPDHLENDQ